MLVAELLRAQQLGEEDAPYEISIGGYIEVLGAALRKSTPKVRSQLTFLQELNAELLN